MSYLPNQKLSYRNKKPISVKCDICNNVYLRVYASAEKNVKHNGKYICCVCKGVPVKPQWSQDYWTEEKRKLHGLILKKSQKYKNAISQRDQSGEKNGMFGKKLSDETKHKMSLARTGKIGKNATGWKGGKTSITSRVKGFVYRSGWYSNVYKRDGWKCAKCGSSKKIDAHHIDPVVKIINRLCKNKCFKNKTSQLKWLSKQPEILDAELKNGVTLCRECHKKEHNNWGSHTNPTV